MPQVLVPVISALGSSIGGVAGAALIMNAAAIAGGTAILGTFALKGLK